MGGLTGIQEEVLLGCPLFTSLKAEEIDSLLDQLGSFTKTYKCTEMVFLAGEKPKDLNVVLEGKILLIKESGEGTRTLIDSCEPGTVFGEATSISKTKAQLFTSIADEESAILHIPVKSFLPFKEANILVGASGINDTFLIFIENLLHVLARRNVRLGRRLSYLHPHDLRTRLSRYLRFYQKYSGSDSFSIPFNRDELASFLAVNRSALSRELSKMRDEGLLTYSRESFTILGDLKDK